MEHERVERIPPAIAAASAKYRTKAALAPQLGADQHDIHVHGARGPPGNPFPRLKPGDRWLTPAQAEKVAGVSRETLRKNSDLGIGAHRYQLSRRRFAYRASDFLEITDPPAQAD
jgi:hypothetical protein